MAVASESRTSIAVFGSGNLAVSLYCCPTLPRLCMAPIFAASSGSECRAHLVFPCRAHASHRLPFLFLALHFVAIVSSSLDLNLRRRCELNIQPVSLSANVINEASFAMPYPLATAAGLHPFVPAQI